ncbi:uncharacterized protein LOC116253679 [Nymphaea colorata]|uniref:uncharacterized protein LOC116253679 n=1 Tax=Nymphaea colorata TaxID=210225 RepID=UPI00129EE42B|nr:uncharacterized protein LOC116253679 [Nymphaea colorata]
MDWFGWLSKTGLEPSLVYEYGLTFARNELEEDDIAYFSHDFLQSMGITVAKHRLEILKLAKKERGGRPQPLSRLLAAIRRSQRYVFNRLHDWLVTRESSSLAIVPKSNRNRSWKVRKARRLMSANSSRLLLTNGSTNGRSTAVVRPATPGGSPLAFSFKNDYADGGSVSPYAKEEIHWSSMFQDLKPT